MARYRVAITMQVSTSASVVGARLRALRRGDIECLGVDMLRVTVDQQGRDAGCAAQLAFLHIRNALPDVDFTRPPVWTTRQLGLAGLRRRSGGRLRVGGDDDGLDGVREPRRPLPPTSFGSLALELPRD